MGVIEIIGGALMIILSVLIVLLVLFQESPKGSGVGALTGGDSYYNKNQGRTRDALLGKATRILGTAFILLTVVVYAIDVYFK